MAIEGIKERRLIFVGNEVRGMEDSALFHRLPDREPDPLVEKNSSVSFILQCRGFSLRGT